MECAQGPANDWLADETVMLCAVVMVAGGAVLLAGVHGQVADRRPLRPSATACTFGSLFSFVLGVGSMNTYLYRCSSITVSVAVSMMINESVLLRCYTL